jgi:hypothetical protein
MDKLIYWIIWHLREKVKALHYYSTALLVKSIEVKKSGNPSRSAVKNFKILEEAEQKVGMGSIICLMDDLLPVDKRNWFVPAWII